MILLIPYNARRVYDNERYRVTAPMDFVAQELENGIWEILKNRFGTNNVIKSKAEILALVSRYAYIM